MSSELPSADREKDGKEGCVVIEILGLAVTAFVIAWGLAAAIQGMGK